MSRRGGPLPVGPGSPVWVAGVDEAGRGPLAGPVVAAAVILGPQWPAGIKDSKRLTRAQRERLYDALLDHGAAVAHAVVTARKIDQRNILQATWLAMRMAVGHLPLRPDIIHVDGHLPIPSLPIPQRPFVGGDARCPAIGAASIVAKVVRDRIMELWDKAFPAYGFAEHKGYGTAAHLTALAQHGPCGLHRYSFGPVQNQSLFGTSS